LPHPLRFSLAVAVAVAIATGCAHPEAPTGGPVPETPLAVVVTRPDTTAIVPGWRGPVVIVFDRTLSERGLEDAVSLSPAPAGFVVDQRGAELRVQPRLGWRPGTIYHVEVAPGIVDRFNNRLDSPVRVIFSTGPEIPETRVAGEVTDRIRGDAATGARVDAIRLPDSLTYTTLVDTAGRFELLRIPEGEYLLLGYRDANRNRRLDPFEPRDTARVAVAVGAPAAAELALLLPDTTPPVTGSARITDGWVEIRFDDHLDPEQPLTTGQVSLVGPDGSAVSVSRLSIGAPPRPDTLPGADTLPPRRPLPSQALFAEPAAPLVPDAIYTVTVRDVRNLHGLVGGGEVPLRVPLAPPAPEPEPDPEPRPPPDPVEPPDEPVAAEPDAP
jgi:hypothetical protein